MKLKKGDTVKILLGKDKGRKGKVQKIYIKQGKVLVEGINIYKKHLKSQGEQKKGGIIEVSRPMQICKVALICPSCSKPTRVGNTILQDGKKVRSCKKCKEVIDG